MKESIEDNVKIIDKNEHPIPNEQENEEDNGRFIVFAVNCSWGKHERRRMTKAEKESPLPQNVSFDVPENVLNQAKKPKNVFDDVIESYIYDSLSKKFGYELEHCQIYLPLEKKA